MAQDHKLIFQHSQKFQKDRISFFYKLLAINLRKLIVSQCLHHPVLLQITLEL